MPELPDVELYLSALRARIVGRELTGIRLASPFVLRSVDPPVDEVVGRRVEGLRRLGKRIVSSLEDDYHVVIHLMIAGRFRWDDAPGAKIPGRVGLAAFDFDAGTLILTEASKKKRASLHLVRGAESLADHDRGGVEPLETDLEAFAAAITRERHTLKRALTDQRILSGIGNAYSDEILHRAQLSPFKRSDQLDDDETARLFDATRAVLREWTERLAREAGDDFPTKVTAFRDGMAVHGKYKQPCPVCGGKVMRIRYASNEANYCPTCQTEGKLLADRSLSRLLKKSWPKTLEELEGR
ncbi:MAG TPA: DNA-formamidopyrimidine glycosylase family protein [Sandaracinaceae bacterium LLY-WYZ-13_1]|nr:DNA-formamidopyrimidine glycosylase family protein [Sandaracinaceae bacterium LLY-WYZ-13_1]